MKKRFSEEQIAFALRQAESGVAVAEIVRKMGITEATFYKWMKKYGGIRMLSAYKWDAKTVLTIL